MWLRPATEPGEDRNVFWQAKYRTPNWRAAPGHRAGRGSQLRRAAHPGPGLRWLRPATEPGEDRNVIRGINKGIEAVAAPGHRAGRGSQPAVSSVSSGVPQLRPATEPGEDRNVMPAPGDEFSAAELRPATEPGEDRNVGSVAPWGCGSGRLRPATEPGEDRNADEVVGLLELTGCARPPSRARIATGRSTARRPR